jgi:hypothetical protein
VVTGCQKPARLGLIQEYNLALGGEIMNWTIIVPWLAIFGIGTGLCYPAALIGYNHLRIRHNEKEYVRGKIRTNSTEEVLVSYQAWYFWCLPFC